MPLFHKLGLVGEGPELPEVACKYMHFNGRRSIAFFRFSKASVTQVASPYCPLLKWEHPIKGITLTPNT